MWDMPHAVPRWPFYPFPISIALQYCTSSSSFYETTRGHSRLKKFNHPNKFNLIWKEIYSVRFMCFQVFGNTMMSKNIFLPVLFSFCYHNPVQNKHCTLGSEIHWTLMHINLTFFHTARSRLDRKRNRMFHVQRPLTSTNCMKIEQ